ncbi:DUF2484 family protein [Lacimonas salitolerans]|uniref:DUF2484 family protein n=1 Tax=Lacimonas salitolerans TaxID=1323750 RepID=A0ABW4EFF1_9RHOB
MSPVLIACILWVLAGVGVAMLPVRRQYTPGALLLLSGLGLIVWLGLTHGVLAGLAALAAFVSMMRNPIRYLWRRARGQRPELPG